MESSIDCGLAPPTPLYYSFECKSHARAQRDHDSITNKIYFADFVTLQSPPPDKNHYPLQHRLIGNHWGNSTVKMSCNKCSQLFLTVLLK